MSPEDFKEILAKRDWRKLLPYAPIAAIVFVIVLAVAIDLAVGGPSTPKANNQAPPPESVRATIAAMPVTVTPYVPPATPTSTAIPTVIPGSLAAARDETRLGDIMKVTVALKQYHDSKGEYPSTGGNIQTLCSYPDADAGCKLKEFIDPIPQDPSGQAVLNGYWYSSDGKTYVIIAGMDSPANATPDKCEKRFFDHTRKTNLCCAIGPS